MSDSQSESPRRRKSQRSPNYPYIDLKAALERVHQFYEQEYRNAAPWEVTAQHWGYSPKSSSMDKVVGALNAFGLVEIQGAGEAREIKLTERSLLIEEDKQDVSPERDKAIRDAALSPSIHETIREKYGTRLPSDATISTWLVRERDFNPKVVSSVIANYRSSIEYAKLDSGADEVEESAGRANKSNPGIVEGCYVQWTSQGVAQFKQPRKVVGFSDDLKYAFVEDTATGIPMSEIALQEPLPKFDGSGEKPPLNPFAKPARNMDEDELPSKGSKRATLPLDSGLVKVEWPDSLTADDFDDIKAWLKILERKIGRSANVELNQSEDQD